ncbi:hypothetical protein EWB69_06520 [Salmonella enterica subsp. enterica serovar Stanley]|nr:hypothetical protein [Salmonella enterica subsp. enterica serovar Stanley]
MTSKKTGHNLPLTGLPLSPLRGLFPRHLRAANASVFVHAPIRPQTAPVLGGNDKKSVKKIVQNCALLCSAISPGERPKTDRRSHATLRV